MKLSNPYCVICQIDWQHGLSLNHLASKYVYYYFVVWQILYQCTFQDQTELSRFPKSTATWNIVQWNEWFVNLFSKTCFTPSSACLLLPAPNGLFYWYVGSTSPHPGRSVSHRIRPTNWNPSQQQQQHQLWISLRAGLKVLQMKASTQTERPLNTILLF